MAAAAAKSLQLCPTLCDLIDSSPPGSSVHGIFQAKALEWVPSLSPSSKLGKVKMVFRKCAESTPSEEGKGSPPTGLGSVSL